MGSYVVDKLITDERRAELMEEPKEMIKTQESSLEQRVIMEEVEARRQRMLRHVWEDSNPKSHLAVIEFKCEQILETLRTQERMVKIEQSVHFILGRSKTVFD